MIAIAVIIIAIAITMASITISRRLDTHTYAHNRWEAGSRFCTKIWVGDLLSPRSNYLPFLKNLRIQLSTPWPWGIVRSRLGGRAKDQVQTTILNDIMMLATCHPLPTTSHMPHTTCLSPPGAWRLQLNKSLDRVCRKSRDFPVFLSGPATILKACAKGGPACMWFKKPASACISLGLVGRWNTAMAGLQWLSWI